MEPERGRSIPGRDGAWPRPCPPPGAGSTASTLSTIRSKGLPPTLRGADAPAVPVRTSSRRRAEGAAPRTCHEARFPALPGHPLGGVVPARPDAQPPAQLGGSRAVAGTVSIRSRSRGRSGVEDRGICARMRPRPPADSGEGLDPHARRCAVPEGMVLSYLPDGRHHHAGSDPSRDAHPRRMGCRSLAHGIRGPGFVNPIAGLAGSAEQVASPPDDDAGVADTAGETRSVEVLQDLDGEVASYSRTVPERLGVEAAVLGRRGESLRHLREAPDRARVKEAV